MHDYDDYDFKYTDEVDPNSSLVDVAYYNANTKDLALDLNDQVYVYENVDEADFRKFYTEPSAGRYYNTEFKNKYGPSEFLGHCDDLYFIDTPRVTQASAGTPKGLTDATTEYSLKAPVVEDATPEYSLKTPEPPVRTAEPGSERVVIHYTLAAVPGREFEYAVPEGEDVGLGLNSLSDALSSLGQSGRAVKAVIYFE